MKRTILRALSVLALLASFAIAPAALATDPPDKSSPNKARKEFAAPSITKDEDNTNLLRRVEKPKPSPTPTPEVTSNGTPVAANEEAQAASKVIDDLVEDVPRKVDELEAEIKAKDKDIADKQKIIEKQATDISSANDRAALAEANWNVVKAAAARAKEKNLKATKLQLKKQPDAVAAPPPAEVAQRRQ